MSVYEVFALGVLAAWLLPGLRWVAEQAMGQLQALIPSVVITSRDRAFRAAVQWVAEKGQWTSAVYRSSSGLSLGDGWAVATFEGLPLIVRCSLDTADNGDERGSLRAFFPWALWSGREVMHRWLTLAAERPIAPEGLIPIWRYDYGDWEEMPPKHPRRGDTLFYPSMVKETLLEALDEFYASKEACRQRCEPWRIAFLLEGPPGTGKTSLIHYAASRLRLGLGVVPTRFWQHLRDSDLVQALGELPPGFLVVVEDVDRLFEAQPSGSDAASEVRQPQVDISDMLNLLDGFHTPEGAVFVLTANRPELLPPALMRRLIRIKIDKPGPEQLRAFVETRRPGLGDLFVEALGAKPLTISQIEQLLRLHRAPDALLDAVRHFEEGLDDGRAAKA